MVPLFKSRDADLQLLADGIAYARLRIAGLVNGNTQEN